MPASCLAWHSCGRVASGAGAAGLREDRAAEPGGAVGLAVPGCGRRLRRERVLLAGHWSGELQALQTATEQAFRDLVSENYRQATFENRMVADRAVLGRLATETSALQEFLVKLSATAGTSAAQLESLSGELQRVQQLECQLADCRGAALAESRAAQEQLASLRVALLS